MRGRFFLFAGDADEVSAFAVMENGTGGFRAALLTVVESFCFALSGDAFDAFETDASDFVTLPSLLFASLTRSDGVALALSFLVCHTVWLERDDRHLNFFLQSGRSHWNGCSPVCRRRCALRLYFFEKDLWQSL